MRILDRYIAGNLLRGYATVLLVLVTLFSFLAFIQELEDIGKGTYQIADAFRYLALTLPRRVLDLAPAVMLLGGIMGLETLSRGSELVAIRASGMSLSSFSRSAGKPVLAIAIGVAVLIQFVAPASSQLAEKQRILATRPHGKDAMKNSGFWIRTEHQVLHIGTMWQGRVPSGIELFLFDPQNRLRIYLQAERAVPLDGNEWELRGVHRKVIGDKAITQQYQDSLKWKSFIGKEQLEVLQVPTANLSLSSLYRYLRYLRDTRQQSARVAVTFWKKVILPFSVGTMGLLAIPLGFAHHKPNIGLQLALGGGIGILFFLLNQIATHIGLLAGLDPLFIAAIPLTVVAGLTGYLFWRASGLTR